MGDIRVTAGHESSDARAVRGLNLTINNIVLLPTSRQLLAMRIGPETEKKAAAALQKLKDVDAVSARGGTSRTTN